LTNKLTIHFLLLVKFGGQINKTNFVLFRLCEFVDFILVSIIALITLWFTDVGRMASQHYSCLLQSHHSF